jgi:hypothetical protein
VPAFPMLLDLNLLRLQVSILLNVIKLLLLLLQL